MEVTIEEALKIIEGGRIVVTIIKGNNEDDIKFNQENIEALNTIVYTMRKYQKIEEIVNDRYGKPVFKTLDEVIKVVEDGNN